MPYGTGFKMQCIWCFSYKISTFSLRYKDSVPNIQGQYPEIGV